MNWPNTSDWSDGDIEYLRMSASEHGMLPDQFAAPMMNESGLRATARNPGDVSRPAVAVGLIQFLANTLHGLGWTGDMDSFRALPVSSQLRYVRAYYGHYKGRLVNATAVYMATFTPAFLKHAGEPDYVICGRLKTNAELSSTQNEAFYTQNRSFDRARGTYEWPADNGKAVYKGKGWICVQDLTDTIAATCVGPRWAEFVDRCAGSVAPAWPPPMVTIADVQRGLQAIGYDVGPVDGTDGPKTQAAVLAFQTAEGIKADGIAGVETRNRLEQLAAKVLPP